MVETIEAEACLRPKNQITLPEPIVAALEVQQADTIVFHGVLTGSFGTGAE